MKALANANITITLSANVFMDRILGSVVSEVEKRDHWRELRYGQLFTWSGNFLLGWGETIPVTHASSKPIACMHVG